MLVRLIQLHKDGARLTKEERAAVPPLVGLFSVKDWKEGSDSGRAVRVATLDRAGPDYANTRPSLVTPLFDPVLVRANENGMILVGYQIHTTTDMKPIHYMQEWWLTTIAENVPPTKA